MGLFSIFKKEKKQKELGSTQSMVELTCVNPTATQKDIANLVNIASKNGYHGVCVNSCYVPFVFDYIKAKELQDLSVIATIGFPLGAANTQSKLAEARQAIADGATELDVCININFALEGDYDYVKKEMSKIVKISKGRIVKAIIETCYFDKEQIQKLAKVLVKAKVDYIKTSTGFGTAGATPEIVAAIAEVVGPNCSVKASGGIRTLKQAEDMIRAGATRIGTSTEI